jgi:KUP system potassium uptake protein
LQAVASPIDLPAAPSLPRHSLLFLSLTALGVVFGDIGTSPLYAVRLCFDGPFAVALSRPNVLGVLSLIFWSLILIVSVKYLMFVLRADNRGEGGVLALMALLRPERATGGRRQLVLWLGLAGAALLYGDGMITPAISVLSAVEGLHIATTAFDDLVLPITLIILTALFMVQRHGTARVGTVFGPVTLVWLMTLAALGVRGLAMDPGVLRALNPLLGAHFLWQGGGAAYFVLGAVFLVVTGGEALYADMGHFGAAATRATWFAIVLPALVLNYFGQGALLLTHPEAIASPFFHLAPPWALYPLVGLATAATVIASQAMISGVFSLTRQAVQLGFVPRLQIEHTSAHQIGQIYLPFMNWLLLAATVGLVLAFRSSENLAAAYGIAVVTTMVITTLLMFGVARRLWGWRTAPAAALFGAFLLLELACLGTNVPKFAHGGWFPVAVAIAIVIVMTTWRTGRRMLQTKAERRLIRFEPFAASLQRDSPVRVKGAAVFMTANLDGVPMALMHNLKHNKVLHERVVFLTIWTEQVPHVAEADRLTVEPLGHGFHRVVARYGFMDEPDVPAALAACRAHGLELRLPDTTFFLGHETYIVGSRLGLARWRGELFAFLARNAQQATRYYRLPPNRIVEVGLQVEL